MNVNVKRQLGFSFIELMVAFIILAVGITGAVLLQGYAKKGSFDAMQRAIATELANDIVQRMRANLPASSADSYDLYNGQSYASGTLLSAPENRCNDIAAPCNTFAQIVQNDLYEWEQALVGADVTAGEQNVGGLLNPTGCIRHQSGAITVVISWMGKHATEDAASSQSNISFASSCGSANNKRRQISVETFVY